MQQAAPARRALGVLGALGALATAAACAGGAGGTSPRFRTIAELKAHQEVDSARRAEVAAVRATRAAEPVARLPAAPDTAGRVARALPPAPASPEGRRAQVATSLQGKWIRVGPNPRKMDLPLSGAPIVAVARFISERVGVDIVVSSDPEVQGKLLYGEIRDRPWHLALEALLEAHGLRAVQAPSGIITIVSEAAAARGRRPELIEMQYRDARDVVDALRPMFAAAGDSASHGSVEVVGDPEFSSTVAVYGSPDQVADVRAFLERYDQRPANVSVELRSIVVNRSAVQRKGVEYSFVPVTNDSTGGQSTGVSLRGAGTIRGLSGSAFTARRAFGNTPIAFSVFIDALISQGFAETETTPLVMTTSGQEGRINVGDSYILPNTQPILAGAGVIVPGQNGGDGQGSGFPGTDPSGGQQDGVYPGAGGANGQAGNGQFGGIAAGGFQQFLTGTTLRVTPRVLDGGRQVRMKVDLLRDGSTLRPDGRGLSGGRHSETTTVLVDNNTPVVIGSFTVQGRSTASSGIPILGDLPVIGRLFKRDEVSSNYLDLVIVLVPHVHTTTPRGSR